MEGIIPPITGEYLLNRIDLQSENNKCIIIILNTTKKPSIYFQAEKKKEERGHMSEIFKEKNFLIKKKPLYAFYSLKTISENFNYKFECVKNKMYLIIYMNYICVLPIYKNR